MIATKNYKRIQLFIGILTVTTIAAWKTGYFSEKHIATRLFTNNTILENKRLSSVKNSIKPSSTNETTNPRIEQSMAKINKQLAALQLQLDQLQNERVSDITDTSSPELTLEEEANIAAQMMQEEIDLIENTIDSEEADPIWAQDAHVTLIEALQNNDRIAGIQLGTVECRSTLCRLSLSFDDQSSLDNGLGTIPSLIPWEGQAFFRVDDVESGEALVYLSREGYELPFTIE